MIEIYDKLLTNSKTFDGAVSIATEILAEYYNQKKIHELFKHKEFLNSIPKETLNQFLENLPKGLSYPSSSVMNKCLLGKSDIRKLNNGIYEQYLIFTNTPDTTFEISESVTIKNFITIDMEMEEVRDKIIYNIEDYLIKVLHCGDCFFKYRRDNNKFIGKDKDFYYISSYSLNNLLYYQTKLINKPNYSCLRIQFSINTNEITKEFTLINYTNDERFEKINYQPLPIHPYSRDSYGYSIKEPIEDISKWINSLVRPTRKITIDFK